MWIIGFISFVLLVFLVYRVFTLSTMVKIHERRIGIIRRDSLKLMEEVADLQSRIARGGPLAEEEVQEDHIVDAEILATGLEDKTLPASETLEEVTNVASIKTEETVVTKTSLPVRSRPVFKVESIMSKLGMLLLLISVGFLFKLAYDNGFITQGVTVAIGYIIGLGFLGAGYYVLKKERQLLSQVLFGGGVATFYITTYAAYLAYSIFSDVFAFVVLIAITMMAFLVAVFFDASSIAVIAVLGGLLIPMLVELDFIGMIGLGIYIAALSLGAMWIYFYKRWRTLQVSTILSVFLTLALLNESTAMDVTDSTLFTGLCVLLWLLFTLVEQYLILKREDDRFTQILSPIVLGVVPLVTILLILYVDALSNLILGGLVLVMGLMNIGLTYLTIKVRSYCHISNLLTALSGLLITLSFVLIFDGFIEAAAIIALSVLFYVVSSKSKYQMIKYIGHFILFIGFSFALINLLDSFSDDITAGYVLSHLLIIGLLTLAGFYQKDKARLAIGTLNFQVYAVIFLLSIVANSTLDKNLVASVIIVFTAYLLLLEVLKNKWQLLGRMNLLVFVGFLFLARVGTALNNLYLFETHFVDFIAFTIFSVVVYLLGHFNYKVKIQRVYLKVVATLSLLIGLIVDVSIAVDEFQVGILLAGIAIYLISKFEREEQQVKFNKVLVLTWIGLLLLNTFGQMLVVDFNMIRLISGAGLLGVLYLLQGQFEVEGKYVFVAYSIFYMLITYSLFATLKNGDGTVTIAWATYAISLLTYYIVKLNRDFINYALGLVILVAVKFILIDLSTVSVFWKIITSMAFGIALVGLSYILQPMMKKLE